MTALGTLEAILERVDAVSIPLEVDNAFEVVRRRLFGPVIDETERDLTCEAFRKMYQNSRNEYPDGVNDQRYLQRMKHCYPIHPEIFDRLFQDWAVIQGFQRTRGVLRIMATCISRLYQEQDPSLLNNASEPHLRRPPHSLMNSRDYSPNLAVTGIQSSKR